MREELVNLLLSLTEDQVKAILANWQEIVVPVQKAMESLHLEMRQQEKESPSFHETEGLKELKCIY